MAGMVAEGAVVAFEGAGQHNPTRCEAPLLHRRLREERCPRMPKANDVQRGQIDPTRRLQRKLYRAAKQTPRGGSTRSTTRSIARTSSGERGRKWPRSAVHPAWMRRASKPSRQRVSRTS
jgi:hypothetical protein